MNAGKEVILQEIAEPRDLLVDEEDLLLWDEDIPVEAVAAVAIAILGNDEMNDWYGGME